MDSREILSLRVVYRDYAWLLRDQNRLTWNKPQLDTCLPQTGNLEVISNIMIAYVNTRRLHAPKARRPY